MTDMTKQILHFVQNDRPATFRMTDYGQKK